MELLLPSIEFKIELGKFSTLPAFYIFHARFTLIPQTSFSKSCHCSNLETSTPIGKWKYTNRRTENSFKISFVKTIFFNTFRITLKNYLWAVLETPSSQTATIVSIHECLLFIEHTLARNSGETNRRNDFEHWKRHSRRISNRHEIHATLTGKVTTRTVHVSRTTPVDWASRRAQAPDLSRARDVFLCCGVPFSLSLSPSLTLSLPLSSLFPSFSNHVYSRVCRYELSSKFLLRPLNPFRIMDIFGATSLLLLSVIRCLVIS